MLKTRLSAVASSDKSTKTGRRVAILEDPSQEVSFSSKGPVRSVHYGGAESIASVSTSACKIPSPPSWALTPVNAGDVASAIGASQRCPSGGVSPKAASAVSFDPCADSRRASARCLSGRVSPEGDINLATSPSADALSPASSKPTLPDFGIIKSFKSPENSNTALVDGIWQTDGSRHALASQVTRKDPTHGTVGVSAQSGKPTLKVAYFYSGIERKASVADWLQKMCQAEGFGLEFHEIDILVGGAPGMTSWTSPRRRLGFPEWNRESSTL